MSPEPLGGLTKREYFAAMALQGILADYTGEYKYAAEKAVHCADQLIESLNKERE